MGFSKYLRNVRFSRKETIREFSKFLGVSYSSVSKWEKGERNPNLYTKAELIYLIDGVRLPIDHKSISDYLNSKGGK